MDNFYNQSSEQNSMHKNDDNFFMNSHDQDTSLYRKTEPMEWERFLDIRYETEWPQQGKTKRLITTMLLIVFIFSCLLVFEPFLTKRETWSSTTTFLDEKLKNASLLTLGTSGISIVLELAPGDIGSSVADELAEMSGYFFVVTVTILIEKYLLVIFAATGCFLMALAAILYLINIWLRYTWRLNVFAIKLGIFAIALIMLIPTGCLAGSMIDDMYKTDIENALQEAEQAEEIINAEENGKTIFEEVGDFFVKTWNSIVGTAVKIGDWAKRALADYMKAAAILIATTCGIPIIIVLIFLKLIKALFHRDYSPYVFLKARKMRMGYKQKMKTTSKDINLLFNSTMNDI